MSRRVIATFLIASLAAGCGGGERRQTDTSSAAGAVADTTVPPGSHGAPASEAVTPAVIALGDSIFHGQAAGGICYTCHGPDAKGTPSAPNLTDNEWLNGDGSLSFIEHTVTNGVPTPKKYPGAMPPFGQTLTPQQIHAVAA